MIKLGKSLTRIGRLSLPSYLEATSYTGSFSYPNAMIYYQKNYFSKDNKEDHRESRIREDFDPTLERIENPQMFTKDGELKDEAKLAEEQKEDENEDDSSYNNEGRKTYYYFIIAAVGLLGGYFTLQINSLRDEKKTNKNVKVSYSGKAQIGGPWKLHDIDGKVMSSKDLKGCYYLIYFGFCNCPDVCPQSLYKISKALEIIKKQPEAKYIKLKTVFVSVDPDRDDPERIRRFLKLFDPSIIGVTGKTNQDPDLKDCMKAFKIYASKIELDDATTKPDGKKPYTLDHTIITYLMNDENQYLTHLGSNMSDRDLANVIVDKIMQNETEKVNR